MSNAPAHSLLDILICGMRSDIDNGIAHVVPAHAFRRHFPFIGSQTDSLEAALSELEEPSIQAWLAELGREPGEGHPWMKSRVAARTFSLWALFEFLRFVCHPLDRDASRRLMVAASHDSSVRLELPMPFAKAVWSGYFHLVDHALAHLGVGWSALTQSLFPRFVDGQGVTMQPMHRWPIDSKEWWLFARAHEKRILRLDDTRLSVRQLVLLSAPSRYGSAAWTHRLGRSFMNPPMQAMRLIKDGHKGFGDGEPPALALLMAACGGDRLLMGRLRDAATGNDGPRCSGLSQPLSDRAN